MNDINTIQPVTSEIKPKPIEVVSGGYYFNYLIQTKSTENNPELYSFYPIYIEGDPEFEKTYKKVVELFYPDKSHLEHMDLYLSFKSGVAIPVNKIEGYTAYREMCKHLYEEVCAAFERAIVFEPLYNQVISDRDIALGFRTIINKLNLSIKEALSLKHLYPSNPDELSKGEFLYYDGTLYEKLISANEVSPDTDSRYFRRIDENHEQGSNVIYIGYIDEKEEPSTDEGNYKQYMFDIGNEVVFEHFTKNNFNTEVILVSKEFEISRIDGPLGTQTPPYDSYKKIESIIINGNEFHGYRLIKNSGVGTHLRIYIKEL